MEWSRTDVGWMGERAGKAPAELLVAILGGADAAPDLPGVAAEWARTLPFSAFAIFEVLTNAQERIAEALARTGLPAGRLVLVGIGEGGTICLRLALGADAPCIGVLVYDPQPATVTPAAPADRKVKVRLIGFKTDDPRRDEFLSALARGLRSAGIDARTTQLLESGLTRPAVRLGAAYLAELSAAALDLPRRLPNPNRPWTVLPKEIDDAP